MTTMPPVQGARVDGWDALGRSTPLPHPADHSRRQIGIALGAGAARGWSHIGVLLELAEHGIHPDIVAGTSIGAVVGGCYASGKLAEIEAFARSLTTKAVLSLMDVSFSGVGILTGRKLRERLEETIGSRTFADLDKVFGVVATECGSGNEVWVTKGDVTRAVRASYALPGIFEPVNINGRWLFDGALVNPVPVTVCRALGADLVIAVNLVGDTVYRGSVISDPQSLEPSLEGLAAAEPDRTKSLTARLFGGVSGNLRRLFGKRDDGAPGIGSAMMDAFNIAQGRISRSRLSGDPPDVIINARLGTIGLFDFHRADELIAMGRTAALRVVPDVKECVTLMNGHAAP